MAVRSDLGELKASLYMEDGTSLYRVVDTVDSGDVAAVWLEDCVTLEWEQVQASELEKRGLRRVLRK